MDLKIYMVVFVVIIQFIQSEEKYNCDYKEGYGKGNFEYRVGKKKSPRGCAKACIRMKKRRSNINGASYTARFKACYCQTGMTSRSSNRIWQSCYIVPSTDTEVIKKTLSPHKEKDRKREYVCNYKKGFGKGGFDFYRGEFESARHCALECLKMKKTGFKINGASFSTITKICYCKSNMKRIDESNRWYSCYLLLQKAKAYPPPTNPTKPTKMQKKYIPQKTQEEKITSTATTTTPITAIATKPTTSTTTTITPITTTTIPTTESATITIVTTSPATTTAPKSITTITKTSTTSMATTESTTTIKSPTTSTTTLNTMRTERLSTITLPAMKRSTTKNPTTTIATTGTTRKLTVLPLTTRRMTTTTKLPWPKVYKSSETSFNPYQSIFPPIKTLPLITTTTTENTTTATTEIPTTSATETETTSSTTIIAQTTKAFSKKETSTTKTTPAIKATPAIKTTPSIKTTPAIKTSAAVTILTIASVSLSLKVKPTNTVVFQKETVLSTTKHETILPLLKNKKATIKKSKSEASANNVENTNAAEITMTTSQFACETQTAIPFVENKTPGKENKNPEQNYKSTKKDPYSIKPTPTIVATETLDPTYQMESTNSTQPSNDTTQTSFVTDNQIHTKIVEVSFSKVDTTESTSSEDFLPTHILHTIRTTNEEELITEISPSMHSEDKFVTPKSISFSKEREDNFENVISTTTRTGLLVTLKEEKQLVNPLRHLFCGPKGMLVILNNGHLFNESRIFLKDNSCHSGPANVNDTFTKLFTKYSECGTVEKQTADKILYSNKVYYQERNEPNNFFAIVIECNIKRKKEVVTSFPFKFIEEPKTKFTKSENGNFNVSLSIFKSSNFQHKYPLNNKLPFVMSNDDQIYLQISLDSSSEYLFIIPRDCFASRDAADSTKYYVIKNRCPQKSFELVQRSSKVFQFGFKTIDFLRKNRGMYMHCTTVICDSRTRDYTCDFGCKHL